MSQKQTSKNRTLLIISIVIFCITILIATSACAFSYLMSRPGPSPEYGEPQEMQPWDPDAEPHGNLEDDIHMEPVEPMMPFDPDTQLEPLEPFAPEKPEHWIEEQPLEKIPGWEPWMGPVNPSTDQPCPLCE